MYHGSLLTFLQFNAVMLTRNMDENLLFFACKVVSFGLKIFFTFWVILYVYIRTWPLIGHWKTYNFGGIFMFSLKKTFFVYYIVSSYIKGDLFPISCLFLGGCLVAYLYSFLCFLFLCFFVFHLFPRFSVLIFVCSSVFLYVCLHLSVLSIAVLWTLCPC